MRIEIELNRMHAVSLVLSVAIVACIGYVIAQASVPDPGHSASEIGEGTIAGTLTIKERKVGIGTTNPEHELDVNGDISFNNTLYTTGRMHIAGGEFLYILNKDGVIVGKDWGGTGDLSIEGKLYAPNCYFCIGWSDLDQGCCHSWKCIPLSGDTGWQYAIDFSGDVNYDDRLYIRFYCD